MNTWQIYALGSAFFAGLTAILAKIGVKDINSNLATFIRTIVILIFSFLLISFRSEWQRLDKFPIKTLIFLILSGLATGLSWLCYYRALQLGPVSKVAPVDKLSIVFAMILSFIILKEAASWQILTGGSLIMIGSLIILFST